MHWEILDRKRTDMLKSIAGTVQLPDYYMAGGTALSLQLGLRKSVDFDFFVPHAFNTDDVLTQMCALYPKLTVLQHDTNTLDLRINGIQVSYFKYLYPMLDPYVSDKAFPSLKMAGPRDIAAMKMSAIGGRGSKKDFYDLYHICNNLNITPDKMCDILEGKFGQNTDFSYMVMSLSYFDDADRESLPTTFVKTSWSKIKNFFTRFASQMQREIAERVDVYDRRWNNGDMESELPDMDTQERPGISIDEAISLFSQDASETHISTPVHEQPIGKMNHCADASDDTDDHNL